MKKVFLATAIATLLMLCIVVPSFAADGADTLSLTASSEYVVKGDSFTVTAVVPNVDGVTVGAVEVFYDAEALELVSGAWFTPSGFVSDFDKDNNVGVLVGLKATNISTGAIFSCEFKAKDTAEFKDYNVGINIKFNDANSVNLFDSTATVNVGVTCRGDVSVSVDKSEVYRGDTVKFTATLSEADPALSGSVEVIYDKDVFELVGGTWTLPSGGICDFEVSENVGVFAYMGSNIDLNGAIFTCELKVKDNSAFVGSEVDMRIKLVNDASVCVFDKTAGDIAIVAQRGDVAISFEHDAAKRGDTVKLSAVLSDAESAMSGSVSVSYDAEALEFVGGSWNLNNTEIADFDVSNGKGVFALDAEYDINGTVFVLEFKLKDSAALADTSVCVNVVLADENDIRMFEKEALDAITITCNHNFIETVADEYLAGAANCIEKARYYKSCSICGEASETETFEHGELGDHVFDGPEDNICDLCGYKAYIVGDVDGNDEITTNDAIYLLYHAFFGDRYPIDQACDFDGDGTVNSSDAIYLLYHVFFGDRYPLK